LVGHLACLGGKRKKYKIVVGKLERNKVLGTPRCRYKICRILNTYGNLH
jgi:hypothetical protein